MMFRGATFSPDRRYRYALWRESLGGTGTLAIIGLNPSTADETVDDPTVRRCVGFARRWGYDRLVLLNLFAYRSTNPQWLLRVVEPIGPDNDAAIRHHTGEADQVLAAWGAMRVFAGRAGRLTREAITTRPAVVAAMVAKPLWCLGRVKDGSPRHPLYVRADQPAEMWRVDGAAEAGRG